MLKITCFPFSPSSSLVFLFASAVWDAFLPSFLPLVLTSELCFTDNFAREKNFVIYTDSPAGCRAFGFRMNSACASIMKVDESGEPGNRNFWIRCCKCTEKWLQRNKKKKKLRKEGGKEMRREKWGGGDRGE